jgi:hypothetical protein
MHGEDCPNVYAPIAKESGVPNYGIADDFPKLWELAQAYDFASRLGAVGGTLEQEVDQALRELWDARREKADA